MDVKLEQKQIVFNREAQKLQSLLDKMNEISPSQLTNNLESNPFSLNKINESLMKNMKTP